MSTGCGAGPGPTTFTYLTYNDMTSIGLVIFQSPPGPSVYTRLLGINENSYGFIEKI